MELEELLVKKLINKSIYHPIYGEIGEIKGFQKHQDQKYIIFRERSVANLTEEQDVLRAIPSKLFYLHLKSNELRVNFGPQWISEAPKFTQEELESNEEEVMSNVNDYYKNNSLWQGSTLNNKGSD
ncbi:hypothetical protein GCM10009122_34100 [Fulvivirga kasyanovii]|uniref:Uncharacterized protein n=1 Tax=Fulvivirga kasyanovii TaxID=396812 RepID=A0ABW9RQ95_9BACT|nr:hypothetical protein [Fulvivirga kasyanovii]MTI25459.1 hypothetical protein [Fulvivirga kasyanovii]